MRFVDPSVRHLKSQGCDADGRNVQAIHSSERREAAPVSTGRSSYSVNALVLGAIGLYGVIAHGVTDGTPEIGLRMALGASVTNILRLVLGYGVLIASVGLAIGFFGSLIVTGLMESLLFGVSAADPATYFSTTLILGAVSILACWLPARRAARVDPVTALRIE